MKTLLNLNFPWRHSLLSAMCAGLMWISGSAAAADGDYPTKPVSIIVAYAPGGQGDTFARLVSERLTSVYKQTILVDNKPGVSGTYTMVSMLLNATQVGIPNQGQPPLEVLSPETIRQRLLA